MRKIFFAIALTCSLFLAGTVFTGLNAAEASTVQAYEATGIVNTASSPLNIRQTASSSAKVLGTIPKGATVKITGKTTDWYRVTYNNITGFVSASYIKIQSTTPQVTAYTATGIVNTTNSSLNVRQSASDTSAVIGTVAKGATVKITGKTGNWYRITYGTGTGFVSATYIKIQTATPQPTTPQPVTPQPAAPEVTAYTATGIVDTTNSSLNVRQSASDTSAVIGTVAKGATVKITGKAGNWYRITYGTGTGFVSATYIKIQPATPQPTTPQPATPQPSETFAKLSATATVKIKVSAYEKADTTSKVVKTYSKGATITITQQSNSWYKVKNGQQEIFVKKGSIDVHSTFTEKTLNKYFYFRPFDVAYKYPSKSATKVKKPYKIGYEKADNGKFGEKEYLNRSPGFILVKPLVSKDGNWAKIKNADGKYYYYYLPDLKLKKIKNVPDKYVKQYKNNKDIILMTNVHAESMIIKYETMLITAITGETVDNITEKTYNQTMKMLENLALKQDYDKLGALLAKKEIKDLTKWKDYLDPLSLATGRAETYILAAGVTTYIPLKYNQLKNGDVPIKINKKNKTFITVEPLK